MRNGEKLAQTENASRPKLIKSQKSLPESIAGFKSRLGKLHHIGPKELGMCT